MDMSQIKELAGIKPSADAQLLNEAVEIPANVTVEQVMAMFDAAKRALGLANKLKDPADKKKHMSVVLGGLNKIRAAIKRMSKED